MPRIATGLILLLLLHGQALAATRTVPIVQAAKNDDVEAIRTLLRQRVDVNVAEPDGATALHWAAHHGDAAAVDLLLRAGARAGAVNRFGVTPLALAATNGNTAVVKRLLQAGADPNGTVNGGETVLMSAARAGHADVVRALIEGGADVNACEQTRGQNALMWAAAEGHADVIRLLVRHGADLKAVSHGPSSPKDITDGTSLYSRMAPRVDVFTALQFAVRAGHLDATSALIEAGGSLADETPQRMSLLTLAIANANYDEAALLIEQGADVNAAYVGWSPLHQVVRTRTLNIGQFPVPLPNGRMTGVDIAKMLLARGAAVDARTTKPFRDGYRAPVFGLNSTPFLMAAKGGDVQLMLLLAFNGADVTSANANGTNAIMAAAGLEMQNANEDSGTDADSLAALTLAIDLGAGDINGIDKNGDTAVHGAVFRQTQDNLRLLAAKGANLDVKDKRGKLAIDDALNGIPGANTARSSPRPEAAKVLYSLMLERGLNPPDPTVDKRRYNFGVSLDK
jgi:ankyrin repeat protein